MTPSSITPEQARERVVAILIELGPGPEAKADRALAELGLTWADAAALMAGTKVLVTKRADLIAEILATMEEPPEASFTSFEDLMAWLDSAAASSPSR